MPCPTQVDSFAAVGVEWDSLLARSSRPSIFLTQRWQRVWWEVFGQEEQLHLVPIRVDGTLVGLAPLQDTHGTLTFLGDTDLFDYHDFLYPQDAEDIFFPALVDHLEHDPWHTLDLRSLPASSPTLERLPDLLRRRGYVVTVEQEDVAPGAPLPRTWDDYLAGMRKKDRHELRRKFRRLEAVGPFRYVSSPPQNLASATDDFLALMRASDHLKEEFLTPQREIFLRRLMVEMAAAGWLRLCFLEVNGVRVSSVLCFDHGGTRYLYNSGYTPDYRDLSVGVLLKALCMKEAVQQGLSYFDFLRGDEPYKYHLGARDVALYHLGAQRP